MKNVQPTDDVEVPEEELEDMVSSFAIFFSVSCA
jgi:hypothetical protein